MVDISAISGLMTSMRSVVEITRAMKDLNDANVIQTKVFELTREIMAAQSCAMEAQMAQSALVERIRELEGEKTKLETWNAEKGRYELREVSTGVFAYTLKPGMEQGQPSSQMLCANCFDRGERSVLQATEELRMRRRVHACPRCKSEYALGALEPRSVPGQAITDYDPFAGR